MKKKILTISIAAYNVEKYIQNTLDSLIISKNMDDMEVLVINDGSSDSTTTIVEKYVNQYPDIFKLINKENAGYGSTINVGLKLASGKYFKQLDGDDWFERENISEFLNYLKTCDADCIYSPFWKVYQNKGNRKLQSPYGYDESVIDFRDIYMHALTFKTDLFLENGIKITENCFYTDCEYNLKPLMFVNKIAYFDKPIYCYRLEEDGQSVSSTGWKKHYKEHNKVTLEIMSFYAKNKDKVNVQNRYELEKYIAKLYKMNLILALEIEDNAIWNEFIKLEHTVKNEFPYFYEIKNKKLEMLRLSKYKIQGLIKLYHKIFEKKVIG